MPRDYDDWEARVMAERWQFDRRVSVGHIVSMLVMLGMLLGVYVELNNKMAENEARIASLERVAERHDERLDKQLDQINHKLDTHMELHIKQQRDR